MAEIRFVGETFEAEAPSSASMMDFAEIASTGVDSNQMAAMVAMKELLRECFQPAEFDRFWAHAKKTKAKGDVIMAVIADVVSAEADRPTSQPSDSSAGLPNTPLKSAVVSSSPVVSRLEEQGRPDLALLVSQAQEARSA